MKLLTLICLLIPVFGYSQTGCVSGDCNHGFGVYVFPNGDRYEGNFKGQKLNGFGYYTESNGNKYTGDFVDNKFHGVGKYESLDGTYYIGQFENGVRQGLGTNYFSKTYFEKGKWANNRFVENAEFENFVVADPNSFAGDINRIIKSAPDGFVSIKGEQINKLIEGVYHSTLKLKFFSGHEIGPNGFSAVYFNGTAAEAEEKFEELKQIIQPCLAYDCCSYSSTATGSTGDRSFEYTPTYIRNDCDQRLKNVKVRIEYKKSNTSATVGLRIYM